MLFLEGYLGYKIYFSDNSTDAFTILFALEPLPALLEIVFSSLLTISAYYIASYVRNSTGKKQNTCLLLWHLFNLLVLIIINLFIAVLDLKQDLSFDGKEGDPEKYNYYRTVAKLVKLNIEFYVDLFLLWLLYRFM